jgi:steroid 5-alpha reductase family enzyme
MSFFEVWGIGALVVWGYVTLIWIASVILTNASIVDIFWGLGFVVLSLVYFGLSTDGFHGRQFLILALVTTWGLRLSGYILARNWGKGEDYRYRNWREQYGQRYWWISYFQVFILQGAIMWLISATLLAAFYYDTPDYLTPLDVVGVMLWTVGFFFEAVGDWHLMQFKRNPANEGKVLDSGVWAYTRHPNYFGDAAQWWAYYLIALSTGWGALTVFGPALMTFLLIYVSGVAMLERSMKQKPKYADYIARTSAFFPRIPKGG